MKKREVLKFINVNRESGTHVYFLLEPSTNHILLSDIHLIEEKIKMEFQGIDLDNVSIAISKIDRGTFKGYISMIIQVGTAQLKDYSKIYESYPSIKDI